MSIFMKNLIFSKNIVLLPQFHILENLTEVFTDILNYMFLLLIYYMSIISIMYLIIYN